MGRMVLVRDFLLVGGKRSRERMLRTNIREGMIDLTHVGKVNPDFFVSNCHK